MLGWIVFGIIVALTVPDFHPSRFSSDRPNQVGIVTRKMLGQEQCLRGRLSPGTARSEYWPGRLMPGLYWRLPIVWSIAKVPVIAIDVASVGLVEAIDGEPLPKGRVLGDEVECNQFQDATMFLHNHGKKGPQVGILRPGTYRINTKLFTVTIAHGGRNFREYDRHCDSDRRHSFAAGIHHRSEGQKCRRHGGRPQVLPEWAALH